VRELLQLRRIHSALRTGKLFHILSDDDSYVFVRQNEDERLLVVFNNSQKARTLKLIQANTPLAEMLQSTSIYGDASAKATGEEVTVTVAPQSVSIFSLE